MKLSLKHLAIFSLTLLMISFSPMTRAQVAELTDEQFEQTKTAADAPGASDQIMDALGVNVTQWKLPLDQDSRALARDLDQAPLNRMLRFPSSFRGQLFKISGIVQIVSQIPHQSGGLKYTTINLLYEHPQVDAPKSVTVFIPQHLYTHDVRQNSRITVIGRYLSSFQRPGENLAADNFRKASDDDLVTVHPLFVGIVDKGTPASNGNNAEQRPNIFNTTQPAGDLVMQIDSIAEMLKPVHGAGVTPLTESQRLRMISVFNDAERVEETGFYALAQNAQSWKVTEPVGISPIPYEELKSDFQKYQGVPYMIEGDLVRVYDTDVSRDDDLSAKLQCWYIEIPTSDSDKFDYIIVYMTDPPNMRLRPEYVKNPNTGRPAIDPDTNEKVVDYYEPYGRRQKVKLVARFYKNHMMTPSDGGMEKRYPAFVGSSAVIIEEPTNYGMSIAKYIATFVVLLLFMGGFGYVWTVKKRSGRSPNGLRDGIAARRAQREEDGVEEEEDYVEPDNLPEDPLAALGMLKQHHPVKGDPIEALTKMEEAKKLEKAAATEAAPTVVGATETTETQAQPRPETTTEAGPETDATPPTPESPEKP